MNEWLESKSDSKILAILYLLDLSRHVLSCGKLTNDAAFEMQLAIERVLPKPIKQTMNLSKCLIAVALMLPFLSWSQNADTHVENKDGYVYLSNSLLSLKISLSDGAA